MTEIQQDIAENIAKYGWHFMAVYSPADDSEPLAPFGYSIGMAEHGLPEFIIFGLDTNVAHSLISSAIREMRDDLKAAPADGSVTNELATVPMVYRDVPAEDAAKEHTVQAEVRYGRAVPVVQIVWPDRNGKFPWDSGCEPAVARLQSEIVDWTHEDVPGRMH